MNAARAGSVRVATTALQRHEIQTHAEGYDGCYSQENVQLLIDHIELLEDELRELAKPAPDEAS